MNFSILRRSLSLNKSKTKNKSHQDLNIAETSFSVLKGETLSINKILSRESSLGQSSHIYYTNAVKVGVPFQWEKKPGTPMNPPQEDVISQQTPPPPPPPPPPAMQSLVLRRPVVEMKSSSLSWRFWSWRRRLNKNTRLKTYHKRGFHLSFSISSKVKGNKVSSLDGDSNVELVGWIHCDSKSLSSSTLSSSIGISNEQFESFRKGIPFCCTTWRR